MAIFIAIAVGMAAAGYYQAKKAQKAAKKAAEDMAGVLYTKESTIESVPVIYGERRSGGIRVFMETKPYFSGDKHNKDLYMAIVLSEGEVESISDILIDDRTPAEYAQYTNSIAVVNSSGVVVGTGDNQIIEIYYHKGSDTQAASPLLMEAPSWTSSHTLSGFAYLAVRLRWKDEAWQGIPNITALVKGRKVYDPRTSTTAYSNNAALCLRDYLLNDRFGKALPANAIDEALFEQAADDIDSFNVTPYSGASSAIKLFQLNAVIKTDEELFQNVEKILMSCRGFFPYRDGKYGLTIDQASSPVMTIDSDMIIGGIDISGGQKDERFNIVEIKFPNKSLNYNVDTAVWPDPSSSNPTSFSDGQGGYLTEAELHQQFVDEDLGHVLKDDIDLECVTNYYAARDMARIFCLRSRNDLGVTIKCTSEAMDLVVGDVVAITHPTPAWTAKPFQVESVSIEDDGSVSLQLLEYASNIYAYDPANEERDYPDSFLPDPFVTLPPESPSASNVSVMLGDGTLLPRMKVEWTDADDAFVESYEIRYKLSTATNYEYVISRTTERVIEGIKTGTYNVSVRSINSMNVKSAWTDASDTDVSSDTTAPDAPTSVTATGGVKSIELTWDNPSDADFKHVEVYVNTTDTIPATPTARVDGESYILGGLTAGNTRYFWLKSVDFTGNKSDATLSVNGTAVAVAAGTDVDVDFADVTGTTKPADNATKNDGALADKDTVGETDIDDGAVSIDKIASSLQSTNYVAGTSGWKLTKAGEFEAGSGTFRGALTATSLTLDSGITIGSTNLPADAVYDQDLNNTKNYLLENNSGDNLVKYAKFDSSLNKGSWEGAVVSLDDENTNGRDVRTERFTHALRVSARDSYEEVVKVEAGETLYWSCWVNAEFSAYDVRFGYRKVIDGVAQSSWPTILAASAGTVGWKFFSGSMEVAPDATAIIPFIQLNGFSNFGYAYLTELRISRSPQNKIGGISIKSNKIYAGAGNFNNADTGFYLDSTGKFSLDQKLSFNPTTDTLTVDGSIKAINLDLTGNANIAGDITATAVTAGSITYDMLSPETKNAFQADVAESIGGTNGDFESATGSLLNTITLPVFSHGGKPVEITLSGSKTGYHYTSYDAGERTANYTVQRATNATFTSGLTTVTSGSIVANEYDLSDYYGGSSTFYHSVSFSVSVEDNPTQGDYYYRVTFSAGGTPSFFSDSNCTTTANLAANEAPTGVTSSGGNADTLDNLDSTKFMRTDENTGTTGNLQVGGDLSVTGDLNITGNINSYNVTDLEVTDTSITLNAGGAAITANGAGLYIEKAVDANTDASLTWDAASDEFDFSHGLQLGGRLFLDQNPVGTTYGNGVSTIPTYYIHQKVGDNDGWRMYGEAPATNDVKMIFEVLDDIETGDTWVFRNKKTYGDYAANEVFKIGGEGNITAAGTITASGYNKSNWDTAYTYSQVGHLPLSGGTLTGAVTATNSTHKIGGIKVSTANDSQNYISFYGTTGDQNGNYNHSYIGERIHSGTEGSELVIAKYNDVEGASGSDRVRVIGNNFQIDTYTSATTPSANASLETAATTGTYYTRFKVRQNGDIEFGGSKFSDASRNLTNVGSYNGGGLLTLTNTSNSHLRIAYNSTYYWDIYRESTSGDLVFNSSNTAGEFVRFDATDKTVSAVGGYLVDGTTVIDSSRNVTANFVDSKDGFKSTSNPWNTGDSAYFPNGITTAGGTNWIYGTNTYIGNAPSNGSGHEFFSNGNALSTGDYTVQGTLNANRIRVDGIHLGSNKTINMTSLDQNTFYPVVIPLPSSRRTMMRIEVSLNSGSTPTWSTHGSGFTLNLVWSSIGGGWGTTTVIREIHQYVEAWTSATICGGIAQLTQASAEIVYLRGGANYYIATDGNQDPTLYEAGYSYAGVTYGTRTTVLNNVWDSGSHHKRDSVLSMDATESYRVANTVIVDSNRKGTFTSLNAGGGTANDVRLFTNDTDSRVLKLRDRSNNAGNIVQFEAYNGENRWEIVGRETGTYPFYIYKGWGTGAGYIYRVSQNGNSSIGTGSFTVASSDIYDGIGNMIAGLRHSGSDFPNGTLVKTNIPATGFSGDSFVLECTGKSYSGNPPFNFMVEGYLYNNTIINTGGINNGDNRITYVKAMEFEGNLCFWWPRISYWNSFEVRVRSANGSPVNRVTTIIDSADPTANKKVTINLTQSVQYGKYYNGTLYGEDLNLGANGTTPAITMMYVDSANGAGWDTRIHIGRSDDLPNGASFPTSTAAGGYGISFQANSDGVFYGMQQYSSGNYRPFINWGDDVNDSPFIIAFNGSTRYQLDTSGNFTANGDITAFSDIRIKDNIEVIDNAIEKVKQIRGVTYTRTDQKDTEKRHAGVIAQEVEAVLPEVVRYNEEEDVKTVSYGNMVGLLIEAIKEQQSEIDELKLLVKQLMEK